MQNPTIHYENITDRYHEIMWRVFRQELQGLASVDHLSILLVSPQQHYLHLSSSKDYAQDYTEQGYYRWDPAISREYFEQAAVLPWYRWDDIHGQRMQRRAEEQHQLYGGLTLVRRIGQHYLLYGIASHAQHPYVQLDFIREANCIYRACDDIYQVVRPLFETHAIDSVPTLAQFIPFQGGLFMPKETPGIGLAMENAFGVKKLVF